MWVYGSWIHVWGTSLLPTSSCGLLFALSKLLAHTHLVASVSVVLMDLYSEVLRTVFITSPPQTRVSVAITMAFPNNCFPYWSLPLVMAVPYQAVCTWLSRCVSNEVRVSEWERNGSGTEQKRYFFEAWTDCVGLKHLLCYYVTEHALFTSLMI